MNAPTSELYRYLKRQREKGADLDELSRRFGPCAEALAALQREGWVAEAKKGWWVDCASTAYKAARVRVKARKTVAWVGDALVEMKGNPLGALDRDLVLFKAFRGAYKPVRILERADDHLVGFLLVPAVFLPYRRHQPEFSVLQPRPVPPRTLAHARIAAYPGPKARGTVEVVRELGRMGEPGAEAAVVLVDRRIPHAPSPDAEAEAAGIAERERAWTAHGRLDLRGEACFTIDPENARDFDDAVSLQPLPGGRFLLGFHIADVSHYVRAGSAVDLDARDRGNSVYFPDRVVPMLPEVLSNDLCSLTPGEDRYAMSVLVEVSPSGSLSHPRVAASLIHSIRRFTYAQAQAVLDGADDPLAPTLRAMERVAKQFHAKRVALGSLDFDLPEVGVVLDDAGCMVGVKPYIRTMAHRLVEEFMLAANRIAARWLHDHGFPLLYRVHEPPDAQKFVELKKVVETLGLPFPVNPDAIDARDVQKLVQEWTGRSEEPYLNEMLLRSLMRACYKPENLGHFALAFKTYCHFTSPIRRYADLVVHRQIKRALAGERLTPEQKDREEELLAELGQHVSLREWDAEDAEREVLEWKTIQLLEGRGGQAFEARVNGVVDGGMSVLLPEFAVTGFLPFSGFKKEFLFASTLQQTVTGAKSGKAWRLGDPIRVRLVKADPVMRSLVFEPIES
jgi:ribonuclease R